MCTYPYTTRLSLLQLKEDLDQSMHDSFELEQQVHALKQAVQEQEAELRAAQECRETEKRREKENLTKVKEKVLWQIDHMTTRHNAAQQYMCVDYMTEVIHNAW